MSTALWLLVCLFASAASAHEMQPAIANTHITPDRVSVDIELNIEPLVLGLDLSNLDNTDDVSESRQYNALRMLSAEDLQTQFELAWPNIKNQIRLLAGDTPLDPQITSVSIPEVGNAELPRMSSLTLTATLPEDNSAVRFGWDATLGSLIVRQVNADGDVDYAALLPSGADSEPMPRAAPVRQSTIDTSLHYIAVGFEHIIPKGQDHILFVLGLFFFSLAFRPLLIQVTAFTLAHTVTLALASFGVISLPASVVEPLIALSIAYVALENIRGGAITRTRTLVVFGFGLLHGLGFAYVLGDVGLAAPEFTVSLISFNVGVELGQLSVIGIAYVLIGLPLGKRTWYRNLIAVPCSLAIAAVGLYWTIERVFL